MSNPNPSPLDSLSESQKQQLLCWLNSTSLRKVAALVAKDPPEGFGIRTHTTTLHRYHARHRAQDRAEDIDLARLFATNRPAGSADQGSASLTDSPIMDSATRSLISDWAFEIASSPRRKVNAFKALSRWVLKQRELEQREREIKILTDRLALDREKFEFNAARHALDHHAELGDILENPEGDNEDKIDAARAILFNRPVSELPK